MNSADQVTPELLRGAWEEVSSGGTLPYLERQLYYAVCRAHESWLARIRRHFFIPWQQPPIAPADWSKTVASVPLPYPPLVVSDVPQGNARNEPDLRNYGFDFLVVVESSELAALLYALGLPSVARAAIVSMDGFPGFEFDSFLDAARRWLDIECLHVHPCHRSSELNVLRADRFAAKHGLVMPDGSSRLHSIGLHHEHVVERRDVFFTVPEDAGDGGLIVELENLTPARLLRLLSNALRHAVMNRSKFGVAT